MGTHWASKLALATGVHLCHFLGPPYKGKLLGGPETFHSLSTWSWTSGIKVLLSESRFQDLRKDLSVPCLSHSF